jgi:hypothetical protein
MNVVLSMNFATKMTIIFHNLLTIPMMFICIKNYILIFLKNFQLNFFAIINMHGSHVFGIFVNIQLICSIDRKTFFTTYV